ncbi:MAG: carboxypeptidase regulatory-like domain-containing protein, partial [Planctomycetes bacterium]|nr:carboxypeptidase regulatory-like domain-containing protein [Planctomycetota bacterium]
MARVLLVGVVALFAVFAAVWFLADTAPAVPSGAGPADPDAVEAPAAVEATAALDAPVAIEREAAPEPEAAATNADAGPRSTLRGRCLDADGNPIAGVAAGLTGWGGNSQRVEAWLRDHPEPERLSEEQTTGADGVFEFRFWPPPPFQFFVRLQAPGRATWSQRWNEIPIGSDVDAGDVTLPAGALLRGRVIDADGAPVAKVEIRINASGDRRASRDGGYDTWCTARTRDDGTFASRWALLAGDYDLAIDGHPIEAPKQVTLSGEDLFVDVVLQRIEPGDTITGVVVDESGAPIRGAMVHATGVNTGRINSTDCDGHFRVLRQENSPDEIRISAVHSSYSAADPGVGEAVRWGRDDVRIVLQKGGGVSILAVRADDGTPVEDYVLRILPLGGGFFSSGDARPRGGDHHDKGRENVEGLRPGRHQAFVQPRAGDLAIGSAVLEVTSAGGSPVVVRLAGTSPRQVL